MKYFVYLTTNFINNKQYVGEHSSEDFNDAYLGSGVAIKKALKKYGKENFSRKILETFKSKEEAFNAQKKYIQLFNTLSPAGYNFSPTGGIGVPGSLSQESLQKMREGVSRSNLGKPSHRKGKNLSKNHKLNISLNHRRFQSQETRDKIQEALLIDHIDMKGEKNPMYGKNHSDKSKNLNRISHLKENLPLMRRKQMSNSAKNKPRIICKYCQQSLTTSMHTRWHGEKCKYKNHV